jgi:predicted dehydrogenase
VDFPTRVTVAGSRLRYDDDQETPDTTTATFQCGDKIIAWEGVSWLRNFQTESSIGIEIRGADGTLVLDDDGYTIYDPARKPVEKKQGGRGDAEHIADFLAAVRDGHRTSADIEEGHKSAIFCHLGNIAYRTGKSLEVDPVNGHIKGDGNGDAAALWSPKYRPGWTA